MELNSHSKLISVKNQNRTCYLNSSQRGGVMNSKITANWPVMAIGHPSDYKEINTAYKYTSLPTGKYMSISVN